VKAESLTNFDLIFFDIHTAQVWMSVTLVQIMFKVKCLLSKMQAAN